MIIIWVVPPYFKIVNTYKFIRTFFVILIDFRLSWHQKKFIIIIYKPFVTTLLLYHILLSQTGWLLVRVCRCGPATTPASSHSLAGLFQSEQNKSYKKQLSPVYVTQGRGGLTFQTRSISVTDLSFTPSIRNFSTSSLRSPHLMHVLRASF